MREDDAIGHRAGHGNGDGRAPPDPRERETTEHSPPRPGGGALRMLVWLLVLVAGGALLLRWTGDLIGAEQVPYTAFVDQIRAGNVDHVTLRGDEVRGELVEPTPVAATEPEADGAGAPADEGEAPETYRRFVTRVPAFGDDALIGMLRDGGVEVRVESPPGSSFGSLALLALPTLLLLGFGYLLWRGVRGQGQQVFSMGRSRAKLYQRSDERTTFDDVAGAAGAKTELREIIEFLRAPRRYRTLGGKPPNGVLLVGPPGTGKTLLARATAGEAGVPFFTITGSDFMEMFVGVGASRVRDLFRDARRDAPSIVFIDELDSIGRSRGTGLGGGHDEREQTLNQLLSELDGFEGREGVIVMAASNRPDILDRALLRPGRFDRRIAVDAPGVEARREILEIHARNKPLADDVDLEAVARAAPGFTGADLENLLNEAALLAARDGADEVAREHVERARDKILMGLERKGLRLSEEELRLLAYHEAGHAVVAARLPHADPIHKVSIVPRGRAMGVTQTVPEDDRHVLPREVLLDRMAVMMGGRVAEQVVLGTATSGAEDDLKQATQLARKMVLDWGMSDELGPVAWGGEKDHVFLGQELARGPDYSEETARRVDREVQALTRRAYRRASEAIEAHRDGLERVAALLREHEEITGEAVDEALRRREPRGPVGAVR